VVEIGGPGTVAVSLGALAGGGDVSPIGARLSSSGAGLDPLFLTRRGITLGSIRVGRRADFEGMNSAIAIHRLHPVIDRPFARPGQPTRYFEARPCRQGRDRARLTALRRDQAPTILNSRQAIRTSSIANRGFRSSGHRAPLGFRSLPIAPMKRYWRACRLTVFAAPLADRPVLGRPFA